jgi:hypothetical protein
MFARFASEFAGKNPNGGIIHPIISVTADGVSAETDVWMVLRYVSFIAITDTSIKNLDIVMKTAINKETGERYPLLVDPDDI